MLIDQKHLAVASLASLLILGGCRKAEDLDVDASQCWNPKILRTKVGNAIFDLPPGIKFNPHHTKTPPGILQIAPKSRYSHPEYRLNCQVKDNVPFDLNNHVSYALTQSYGGNSPFLGEIRPYDPNSKDKRFSYYFSDAKDIRKINFPRYTSTFRGKRETERLLVFGFKGREAELSCQVWGAQTASEDAWVDGTTYAYACAGDIPLRMGDIIITVATAKAQLDPDTKKPRMPRPERWPIQWNDVIQKITSYRIDQSGTDNAFIASGQGV